MKGRLAMTKFLSPTATRLGIVVLLVAAFSAAASVGTGRSAPHPLDPYPGFGRSDSAAVRDDAIALWEAYRRDVSVAGCMGQAGFEYRPEVAFPAEPVLAVADYLDISVVPRPAETDPEVWNAEYRAGLDPDELNQYYMALVAESGADMATFEQSGETPSGRDPALFARGGCVGAAMAQIGSILFAYRALEDQLDRLDEDALSSDEVSQARADFSFCMLSETGIPANGPGEAEELVAEIVDNGAPGDSDDLAAGLAGCIGIWNAGYQAGEVHAASAFVSRNSNTLQAQQDAYADAEQTIRDHAEFETWLRTTAGAIAFEQAVSGDGSHLPVDIGT